MTAVGKQAKVPLGANYWMLWSSSMVSNLGDGVARIADPRPASAVTRNPVLIALVAVVLGRLNAMCRFFAYSTMPIGLAADSLIVGSIQTAGGSRELALRMPWFEAVVAYAVLFIHTAPELTTAKSEAARTEEMAAKKGDGDVAADGGSTDIDREAIAETGLPGASRRNSTKVARRVSGA